MSDWAALETPLDEKPLFLVEPPDGRRYLAELPRQVHLRSLVQMHAPAIVLWATPNAGLRGLKAQRRARLEGLTAGVFDLTAAWADGQTAYIELKGYDSRGRAGTLSDAQIRWGNRMTRAGHRCACFFDADAAFRWLIAQGAPRLAMAA